MKKNNKKKTKQNKTKKNKKNNKEGSAQREIKDRGVNTRSFIRRKKHATNFKR